MYNNGNKDQQENGPNQKAKSNGTLSDELKSTKATNLKMGGGKQTVRACCGRRRVTCVGGARRNGLASASAAAVF